MPQFQAGMAIRSCGTGKRRGRRRPKGGRAFAFAVCAVSSACALNLRCLSAALSAAKATVHREERDKEEEEKWGAKRAERCLQVRRDEKKSNHLMESSVSSQTSRHYFPAVERPKKNRGTSRSQQHLALQRLALSGIAEFSRAKRALQQVLPRELKAQNHHGVSGRNSGGGGGGGGT